MIGPLKPEWYGIPFAAGDIGQVPIARWQADLIIWQRHLEPGYAQYKSAFKNPVSEHFLQACRDMLTPRQLRIHSWFERANHAYTMNQEIIYLGAASSGKSHFVGLAFLLDLLIGLGETYCCMVSTSKDTLLQRSFASSLEYLNCLKQNGIPVPLKFIAQKTAIVPSNVDDIAGVKSMLKGIAIAEGSDIEMKSSLIGVHQRIVRAAADEIEVMGPRASAFLAAQSNLRMGCENYKMCTMFNPMSLNSPGTLLATPDRPGGWGSLDPDTAETWTTKEGRCVVRFDALKSPALEDPTLTFLPTQKSLDELLASHNGNKDDPEIWTMARGFPALSRPEGTLLTDAEIITFKMEEPCIWRGESSQIVIAGLDPAFTADGDACILQLADVGYRVDEVLTMQFRNPMKLILEASSHVPMSYQIVGQLRKVMQDTGLKMQNLAIDDSGTQSVADIVAKEIGYGFLRVMFGGKASDLPMSMVDHTPARERCGNMGTEIWMAIAEFGRYGQIRNLAKKASEQFTRRRFSDRRHPKILETKKGFKKRTGLGSPDEADGAALCAAVARFTMGMRPGASMLEPQGRPAPNAVIDMEKIRALNSLKSTYNNRR